MLKTTQRVSGALLSLLLAASLCPSFATAETSANLQAQLTEAQAHLGELYQEAELVSQELNKTIDDLKVTGEKIDQLNQDINTAQDELADAQETLGHTVAANYKAGPASLLETILGATSFEDLVNRVVYADKVAASFAAQIRQVNDMKASLSAQQAELMDEQKEQEQLKAEQEEHRLELEEKAAVAEDYVAGLSDELQAALAAEEEARREAERQAAEAARAAAAAAAAANDQAAVVSAAANNAPAVSAPAAPTEQSAPAQTSQESNAGSSAGSPAEVAGPSQTGGLSHMAERTVVVNYVLAQVGKDYVWATHGPDTFDCSGLVGAAYEQLGMFVGYSDSYQAQYCNKPASEAVYGDIVWRNGHVGICVGDGVTVEAHTPATGIGWGSIYNFSRSGCPLD